VANIAELLFRIRADSKGAAAAVAPLTRELEKAEGSAKDLEKTVNQVDGKTINVDVRTAAIAKARAEIRALREEFARNIEMNVDVDVKGFNAKIALLRAQIKALTPSGGEERAAKTLTQRMGEGITAFVGNIPAIGGAIAKALDAAGPEVALSAAALAAIIAQALLATLGSLLLAGIGSLGIGAMIGASLMDASVANAAKGIVQQIKDAFAGLADTETKNAFLIAFQSTVVGLKDLFGELRDPLRELNRFAVMIGQAVGDALRRLGPGLSSALRGAQPVIEVFAREIPHIADAISTFFDEISRGGKGAALVLKTILVDLELTLVILGFLIGEATRPFDMMARAINFLDDQLDSANEKIRTLTAALTGGTGIWLLRLLDTRQAADQLVASFANLRPVPPDIEAIAQAEREAAQAAEELARKTEEAAQKIKSSFNDVANAILGQRSANRELLDSYDNLFKTIKDNKSTSLNILDIKGRENQANVDAILGNIKDVRQAALDMGVSWDVANAKYLAMLNDFETKAINAGLSKKQIEDVVKPLRDLPAQKTMEIKTMIASGSVDLETLKAEFGAPIVVKLKAEVDEERLQAIPDAIFEKLAVHGRLPAGGGTGAPGAIPVTVAPAVDGGALQAVNTTIGNIAKLKPDVTILVHLDQAARDAAIASLNALTITRTVLIRPVIDQSAVGNVQRGLNNISPSVPFVGPRQDNVAPPRVGGNSAPSTAVNVYVQSDKLAELIGVSVVDAATSAAIQAPVRVLAI